MAFRSAGRAPACAPFLSRLLPLPHALLPLRCARVGSPRQPTSRTGVGRGSRQRRAGERSWTAAGRLISSAAAELGGVARCAVKAAASSSSCAVDIHVLFVLSPPAQLWGSRAHYLPRFSALRRRPALLAVLALCATGLLASSRALGPPSATGGIGRGSRSVAAAAVTRKQPAQHQASSAAAAASAASKLAARGAAAASPTPPPEQDPESVPVAAQDWAADVTSHQQRLTSAGQEDGSLLYVFDTVGHGGRYYVEFGYGRSTRECSECITYNLYKHGWRGLLMDACASPAPCESPALRTSGDLPDVQRLPCTGNSA